jgi:acyl-coenzyme A synthetase/AMP-(fatty) acid ligase
MVSGAHVSPRYFEDPEAMRKTKVHEGEVLWHRMGDTAAFDDAGRLWLTGRVHNLIESATGTVLPMVVERRTEALDFVQGAAVVGVAGAVVGVVEPKTWTPSSFGGWRAQVKQRSPELTAVLFVRSVPRDRRHRSKVDYGAVTVLAKAACATGEAS